MNSAEKKNIVVMGGGIAAGSAAAAVLGKNHPVVGMVWLGVLAGFAVYVVMQMVKIRRAGR